MRCVRREAGRWRDRPPGMGWPGLDGCRITLLTVKSLRAALIASRRPPDPLNPHHLPAPAPPACRRTSMRAPHLAAKEHNALPQEQTKGVARHVLRPARHAVQKGRGQWGQLARSGSRTRAAAGGGAWVALELAARSSARGSPART